ncbi:hypothetical protein ASO20_02515 [Mycoplasma sp. (ex Biomphalaria glabrata)]|uniref:pseudouridine synthase n=1 Tax=Mycoplasma sp. (ex Biomphalaria glabrata) TaxID=1749074 RepID=UPI00073AC875|nr:pseudouridine synthase [Mycoplasma sp. (ex Biomphalaria glabrata)]ALV23508.1 hypothetical protein ASO20_02515 [Mycoplasma sp. (ex Biomphalaria glabrata)]
MKRLGLAISSRGFCSRRQADKLILEQKVKVNGEIVTDFSFKVADNDQITIDGYENTITKNPDEFVYFLFNKPPDCVCTNNDPQGRKTYLDYFSIEDKKHHLFPIGRLDLKSQGLLIVTNDGELYNKLMHPRNHVEKEYLVGVDKSLRKDELKKFSQGLMIREGYETGPCEIKEYRMVGKTYYYLVILKQGKNRQIRESFKLFHIYVSFIERIRIGSLEIGDLHLGKYRKLTIHELEKLKR